MTEAQELAAGEAALRVIAQWTAAFVRADVDAISELHAPDATFLGTTSTRLAADPLAVRAYFEKALRGVPPVRAELLEAQCQLAGPDVAIVSGLDVVAWAANGTTTTWPGRVTFVLRRDPQGWRIVHFHRSALPQG